MPGGGQGNEGAAIVAEQRARIWSGWLELFDQVRPSEIEAMEVFRGVSEIPAEFLDDSCAAVVIGTREGGKRRSEAR